MMVLCSLENDDVETLSCFALIAELVDWARTAGFDVVCAGKGTKHLPEYHHSTPDTVWNHYGLSPEQTKDMNPQMFNSFLDGTKSALEMAAVANGCELTPGFCALSQVSRLLGDILRHNHDGVDHLVQLGTVWPVGNT